ncbi:MAG: class I SAM-dependent methyltransferase [Aureispira sp.]
MKKQLRPNMDWVAEFYQAQNDWFGVYLLPIDEQHEERAVVVAELLGETPHSILELGAGGGQTAVVLAKEGHEVTMIELLEASTKYATTLAKEHQAPLTVLQGDFYTLELTQTFDSVLYFDSFGIGSDADQQRLLQRVATWLKPTGKALIEVGTPWYWNEIAKGRKVDLGACFRAYDFEVDTSRLIDRWWRKEAPEEVVQQSLRCYSPADLELLLQGTGLTVVEIQAGNCIAYEPTRWRSRVTLPEAMTYYAVLQKENT